MPVLEETERDKEYKMIRRATFDWFFPLQIQGERIANTTTTEHKLTEYVSAELLFYSLKVSTEDQLHTDRKKQLSGLEIWGEKVKQCGSSLWERTVTRKSSFDSKLYGDYKQRKRSTLVSVSH